MKIEAIIPFTVRDDDTGELISAGTSFTSENNEVLKDQWEAD